MTRMLKLASAGVGVAALLGLMGASSFANFTTNGQDAAGNNSFKAGYLGITATGTSYQEMTESVVSPNSVTISDTVQSMAPGDSWAKTLTIKNTGNLPELYQVAVAPTGRLFQNNPFTGWGNTISNYNPATVTISGTDSSGTVTLINGAYDENPLTSSQWVEVGPGATDTLTVTVSLPYAANNAYQNASGSFAIQVNAQQADNNSQTTSAISLN